MRSLGRSSRGPAHLFSVHAAAERYRGRLREAEEWQRQPVQAETRGAERLKCGKSKGDGCGCGSGGRPKQQNFPRGFGRRLKMTIAARPRSSTRWSAGGETSKRQRDSTLLMAGLEGLAPPRRPHRAVEVAVTPCQQRRSSHALPRLGGLPSVKSYVNTIVCRIAQF